MRVRALSLLGLVCAVLSALAFAVSPDRITETINPDQKVRLTGNLHGLATSAFDVGRVEGTRLMPGVTLAFHLSPAQQKDLDLLLTQLQDRKSHNYHKFLTVEQFAARFGMSLSDVNKVQAWLRAEGFSNISVANSHNAISFDGTVEQVERVFETEMHAYLVDGVVHLANATEPSVPLALADTVLYIDHLNSFSPKPRVKAQPHLTSYLSGNHFLTPDDFATIYDVNALYSAGSDGTGQKIAVVGQSTVSTTDLNNFRKNAGLSASTPTLTLIEGTATRCSGDEFESDLDLEWSGGVAKNASVIFLYAGLNLGTGDTCSARVDSVWDALDYAVQHNVAPFISTSYGFCEPLLNQNDPGFIQQVQLWAQQGQTQGQTIVSATGDAGAADCDSTTESSATGGLAVDVPASIPEVTGAGGNEFTGDASQCPSTGCTTSTAPADPPYWGPSNAGSDAISTALEYIPETAWNDTTVNHALSASGGGASIIFAKPTWQTGTGVPNDGKRDVPDVSITASPDHDPYLICSEDNGAGGTQPSCVSGFRDAAGGNFTAVGGTSAAAPTFTAIMTLVNQFVGNVPPTGLAPINPTLYTLPGTSPNPFHDVSTGNNIVPCTNGTTGCTTGSYGFSARVGYDQVTGLGSVDAFNLASAWLAQTTPQFSLSATGSPVTVSAGTSGTVTITVTPLNSFTGNVSFSSTTSCSGLPNGASCSSFNPTTVTGASGSTTMTISTLPNVAAGSSTITVTGTATGSAPATTTVSLTVTATTESFTLTSNLGSSGGTLQVAQGSQGQVNLGVCSTNGFVTGGSGCPPPNGATTAVPVTYTCTGFPSESNCTFSPSGSSGTVTSTALPTLMITAAAPSAALHTPFDRGMRIFYAALLPGLFGIMFTLGSRKQTLRGMRMIGLMIALGFSTLWLGSCSGSNGGGGGGGNPGTPTGSYPITVTATAGGTIPNAQYKFTLKVVQ